MERYAGPGAALEERVTAAIKEITELRRYNFSAGKGPFELKLQRAIDRCLIVAMSMFFAAVPLSVVLHEAHMIKVYGSVPLVGLIAGGSLALLVPVLSILSELIWLSLFMLKPGKLFVAEASYDFSLASELVRHSDAVLAVADKWLEQKCRRMERRMVRILGGSDKIALLVVFGLAWGAWKAIDDPVFSRAVVGTVNVAYCALAFSAGLILGGMTLSRMLERMAFQRDVIALARDRIAREADGGTHRTADLKRS